MDAVERRVGEGQLSLWQNLDPQLRMHKACSDGACTACAKAEQCEGREAVEL